MTVPPELVGAAILLVVWLTLWQITGRLGWLGQVLMVASLAVWTASDMLAGRPLTAALLGAMTALQAVELARCRRATDPSGESPI